MKPISDLINWDLPQCLHQATIRRQLLADMVGWLYPLILDPRSSRMKMSTGKIRQFLEDEIRQIAARVKLLHSQTP